MKYKWYFYHYYVLLHLISINSIKQIFYFNIILIVMSARLQFFLNVTPVWFFLQNSVWKSRMKTPVWKRKPKRKQSCNFNLSNLLSIMSISSIINKQDQKKITQKLSKKTHFTEAEVGKLLDCHFQIMVCIKWRRAYKVSYAYAIVILCQH